MLALLGNIHHCLPNTWVSLFSLSINVIVFKNTGHNMMKKVDINNALWVTRISASKLCHSIFRHSKSNELLIQRSSVAILQEVQVANKSRGEDGRVFA